MKNIKGLKGIPNFWMRVNKEQTMVVQYWLFNLGAVWCEAEVSIPQSYRNPIIIYKNGEVTYASDIKHATKLMSSPDMMEFTFNNWVNNYHINESASPKIEEFEGFEVGDEVFIINNGGSIGGNRDRLACEGDTRWIKAFKPPYWLTTYIYDYYITFDNDAAFALSKKEDIHKYLVKAKALTCEDLKLHLWYVATFLDGSMLIFKSCGESIAFTSGIYTTSGKILHTEVAGHVFTYAEALVKKLRHATLTEVNWAMATVKNHKFDYVPVSLTKPEREEEVITHDLLKTWGGLTEKNHLAKSITPEKNEQPEILKIYTSNPRVFNKTGFVPIVINNLKQFKI